MLAPLALLEQLQARVDECLGAIPAETGSALASLILELPQIPALPPEIAAPRFGLVHGRREELRAGYGVAAERRAAGPGRLAILRDEARCLARDWLQLDPDETGFGGFALLGFAADPESESAPPARGLAMGAAERTRAPRATPVASERDLLPEALPSDMAATDTHLPNALLWVPELGVGVRRGQAALILTARLPMPRARLRARWHAWLARLVPALSEPLPEPRTPAHLATLDNLPGLPDWQVLVDCALDEIRQGSVEKVVLCRRVGLQGRRPFDLRRLQAALAWLFPACQVIHIRRGDASFVAATPERLLTVSGRRVEVDAIAGTAARSASTDQDAALTAALRTSDKNRREHALVVGAVQAALAGCCTDLEVPPAPEILQLHNAQHLWSPIGARLGGDTDIFDLADRLHPTPATNGTPTRAAQDWLRRAEPIARGWYTGAAGILELPQSAGSASAPGALNGELWVLLRCAEVLGDRARLYAGAGIVSGSEPLAEWRETAHKLAAVATALRFA